jgi:hypothetical protein
MTCWPTSRRRWMRLNNLAELTKNPAGFSKNWSAEILTAPPMIAPARQFVYPQFVPGEEDAMARGALLLMVRPAGAAPFLATCARGFADAKTPTGVFACPNPDELCAIAGGYAYIVNVREPAQCAFLALKPVVEVHALVEDGLLLFVGFHALMAWGVDGLAWQTGKLSDEGLRIVSAENGALRGFGWKLMTDKEVPFALDLKTGSLL